MNGEPVQNMHPGLSHDDWLKCVAAGDIFQTARHQIRSALRQAHGNRYAAIDVGLTRLREQGQITQTDHEQVSALVEVARSLTEAGITAEMAEKLRGSYRGLVGDRRSSAVALSIASILNSLADQSEPIGRDSGVTGLARTRAENVIVGAIVGGVLGFVVGGVPGAVSGAVAGANAGACAPSDEPD